MEVTALEASLPAVQTNEFFGTVGNSHRDGVLHGIVVVTRGEKPAFEFGHEHGLDQTAW
ncbi:MAG: hypothetical protein BWY79_01115 [Actinobacteria bacterium ADurb.Bin444]|nr:MAG: hypothetical protein BWY79_01115 [Actinobacteria bacterium ADurb.Bin444]